MRVTDKYFLTILAATLRKFFNKAMNLFNLIQESNLSQSQKSFWKEKTKNTSEVEKEAYLTLFKNWSNDVEWVTELLMMAEIALREKDMEKYGKIQNKMEEKLVKILKS